MKNRRFIRNYQTKFVDLIETKNLENLRFFRVSHLIVKKLNFGFPIVFFQIKKEIYTSYETMLVFKLVDLYVVNNFVS